MANDAIRRHAQEAEPAKHDYCKIIRDLPVDLIDGALVLKVLRPIWNDKTETASRLRGRIETILDYAKVALKLREGDNPARWAKIPKIQPAPEIKGIT